MTDSARNTDKVWERHEDILLVTASFVLAVIAAGLCTLLVNLESALMIGILVWMVTFGLFCPRIVEVGFSRWDR